MFADDRLPKVDKSLVDFDLLDIDLRMHCLTDDHGATEDSIKRVILSLFSPASVRKERHYDSIP